MNRDEDFVINKTIAGAVRNDDRAAMMIAAASRRTSGGNNGARMTSGANKTATKNRADTAADRPAHSPPASCPTKSN